MSSQFDAGEHAIAVSVPSALIANGEIVLEVPFVTYRCRPSGLIAIRSGKVPVVQAAHVTLVSDPSCATLNTEIVLDIAFAA